MLSHLHSLNRLPAFRECRAQVEHCDQVKDPKAIKDKQPGVDMSLQKPRRRPFVRNGVAYRNVTAMIMIKGRM